MANQTHYTAEFKKHVVAEALQQPDKHDWPLVAKKYGVRSTTLREWIKLYEEYGEAGFTVKTRNQAERERIKELEKEIVELKEENEILKKAAAFLAEVGRK